MYTNIWIVEEVYKNLPIESFQGYLDANNLDYNFFGDDSIYRNHYQSFASPMQFYWGKNFGMGTIRKKSGFPYLDLKLALALPTKISGNWILDLSLLQHAIKLTIYWHRRLRPNQTTYRKLGCHFSLNWSSMSKAL